MPGLLRVALKTSARKTRFLSSNNVITNPRPYIDRLKERNAWLLLVVSVHLVMILRLVYHGEMDRKSPLRQLRKLSSKLGSQFSPPSDPLDRPSRWSHSSSTSATRHHTGIPQACLEDNNSSERGDNEEPGASESVANTIDEFPRSSVLSSGLPSTTEASSEAHSGYGSNPGSLIQESKPTLQSLSHTPIPGYPGFFIACGLKLETIDLNECSQLHDQLQEAFDCEFRPNETYGGHYFMESLMICHSTQGPFPGVVITCVIEDTRKQLRKIVKSQKALYRNQQHRLLEYPVMVCLGDVPARIAGHITHGVLDAEVHVLEGDLSSTLSGVLCSLDGFSGDTPRRFTIGGMILVNGEPHILTIAHSFIKSSTDSATSNESDADWETRDDDPFDDEASDCESILRMLSHKRGDSRTTIHCSHNIMPHLPEPVISGPETPTVSTTQSKRRVLGRLVYLSSHQPIETRSLPMVATSADLALVYIPEHIYWRPNLVSIPGERFPREITELVDGPASGEVWINCGVSGLRKGWLVDGTAFLNFDDARYHVRKILLSQRLCMFSSHVILPTHVHAEVLTYLQCQAIPVPGSSGKESFAGTLRQPDLPP